MTQKSHNYLLWVWWQSSLQGLRWTTWLGKQHRYVENPLHTKPVPYSNCAKCIPSLRRLPNHTKSIPFNSWAPFLYNNLSHNVLLINNTPIIFIGKLHPSDQQVKYGSTPLGDGDDLLGLTQGFKTGVVTLKIFKALS